MTACRKSTTAIAGRRRRLRQFEEHVLATIDALRHAGKEVRVVRSFGRTACGGCRKQYAGFTTAVFGRSTLRLTSGPTGTPATCGR